MPYPAMYPALLCNLPSGRRAKCYTICRNPYLSYGEGMWFSRYIMVFAICKENSGKRKIIGKNCPGKGSLGKLFVLKGKTVQYADYSKHIFIIKLL